ncbi:hypothetical protein EUTSA_v10011165mg [Eutrema salsugineum]|uniref:Uncharacterized protein n=1 Tax=Eutrema salsugineum TaxID=72664 RepID=V4LPE5_EUTSA|nr:hypothetical protein EUTSA_v10011165mg [Eutrema salsugineum]
MWYIVSVTPICGVENSFFLQQIQTKYFESPSKLQNRANDKSETAFTRECESAIILSLCLQTRDLQPHSERYHQKQKICKTHKIDKGIKQKIFTKH